MDILNKLEEIKKQGNYSVVLYYGEELGCDDMDIETSNRNIKVTYYPIGFLGGKKRLINCKLLDFLSFDINKKPTRVNNPPSSKEISDYGFYEWGTERALKED